MSRARSIGSRPLVAALVLLSLVGVGAACESSRYGHVELYRTGGHPAAEIGPDGLSVPEGGVILFEAQPRAEAASPAYEGLERFSLRSSDEGVAKAQRSILRDSWVVSGMSVGSARLHVIIDGNTVDEVPVEIFVNEGEGP